MFVRYIKGLDKASNKLIKNHCILKEARYKTKHYIVTFKTTNKKVIINAHLTSKNIHNTLKLENSFNNKITYLSKQLTVEHTDKPLFLKVDQALSIKKCEKVFNEVVDSIQNNKEEKFQVVDMYEGRAVPLENFSEEIVFETVEQEKIN